MNIEMITALFKKKKQIVVFAAAGLCVCGFVFLHYLPLRDKAELLKKQQSLQQAVIDSATAKALQLPGIEGTLEKFKAEVSDYGLKIPDKADLGEFVGKIASLMDKHQLTEQMIEPREKIETARLSCIPVTMKCKGRLTQIRQFYQSLQGLDRTVRIEKFKLANDRELTGVVSMETEAVIYYTDVVKQG